MKGPLAVKKGERSLGSPRSAHTLSLREHLFQILHTLGSPEQMMCSIRSRLRWIREQ